MTTAAIALIQELHQLGIRLEPGPNGKLFVEPANRVTEELKARLIEGKPALLAYLRDQAARPAGDWSPFARPVAFGEVLGFPAKLLPDLPLPPVLAVEAPGVDGGVMLDFRPRPPDWRRRPAPARATFDADEIAALLEGAECDRVWPQDFAAFAARKARQPGWRLTREAALAGAQGLIRQPLAPQGWTLQQLFDRISAALRMVQLDTQPRNDERGRLRAVVREPDGSIYEDCEDGRWPVRGPKGGDA